MKTTQTVRSFTLLALAMSSPTALAEDTSLTIAPAAPTSAESVYISMTHPLVGACTASDIRTAVSMEGQTIDVVFTDIREPGSAPCPTYAKRATVQLPPLPAGSYAVNASFSNEGVEGTETGEFEVVQATYDDACASEVDSTGFWWDTSDPGWSVSRIRTSSGKTAALWATFDEDGAPMWLAMMPQDANDDCYSAVVKVTGGTWLVSDADGSGAAEQEVIGRARFTVDFRPPNELGAIEPVAFFEYTVNDETRTRVLKKAQF